MSFHFVRVFEEAREWDAKASVSAETQRYSSKHNPKSWGLVSHQNVHSPIAKGGALPSGGSQSLVFGLNHGRILQWHV